MSPVYKSLGHLISTAFELAPEQVETRAGKWNWNPRTLNEHILLISPIVRLIDQRYYIYLDLY